MDISKPRVDHRKSTSGVTGSAFPLYEYVVALSYKVFGEHHSNHRIIQFIIYFIGVIGIYLLVNLLFKNDLIAFISAAFYAWSPELYYHGINALPDISAMTASIWALYFYQRFKENDRMALLLCFTLVAIAGLIKLQYLLFIGFMFIDALVDRNRVRMIGIAIFGSLAAGITLNWYIYSIKLRYASNLQDYGLFLNPADDLSNGLRILKNNILIDLPEQLFGFGAVVLILIAVILFHIKASKQNILKAWLVLFIFFVFHYMELKQMEHHAYYLMPYVIFGVLAIAYLLKTLQGRTAVIIVSFLLGVQLYHSVNKINSRYSDENSQLPPEFLNESVLAELRQAVDPSSLAVVGPDHSGCIYFYYLGLKGWNAFSINQLESKDDIKAAIEKGKVQQLVVRGLDAEHISKYQEDYPLISRIGDFVIMKNDQ